MVGWEDSARRSLERPPDFSVDSGNDFNVLLVQPHPHPSGGWLLAGFVRSSAQIVAGRGRRGEALETEMPWERAVVSRLSYWGFRA